MSNLKILCLPPIANTLRDLDMRFTWVMHELWNLCNCVHVSNFKQSQEVSAKLNYHMDLNLKKYSQLILQCIEMSRNMRFPTMWYVRPAKAQTSLRIRTD